MKKTLEILNPYCYNETDMLEQVIIGYPDNLYQNREFNPKIDGNNQKTIKNRATGNIPKREESMKEFAELRKVMEANGAIVLDPDPCPPETLNINQMFIRDIGFVVGEKFFVSNMARLTRRREWESIEKFIDKMPIESVVRVPEGVVLEGGDIVVDKENVYVGLSQRTTKKGLDFLSKQLEDTTFNIVPVELLNVGDGEDVLHLDCAFIPVGKNSALIYSKGMVSMPKEIFDDYDLIDTTFEEQNELVVNVISLSPQKVVSRNIASRINSEMKRRGIEVFEIPFNEAPKSGGSLRCCTLPLRRKNKINTSLK